MEGGLGVIKSGVEPGATGRLAGQWQWWVLPERWVVPERRAPVAVVRAHRERGLVLAERGLQHLEGSRDVRGCA